MLSAPQVSQLLAPVACRAKASDRVDRSGFVDRAAHNVLKRLGRSAGFERWPAYNENHVKRWRWIDLQSIDFFKRHPQGTGVEVNGGLSTRFHRVSEQLDWPRFSWRAINTSDITDCLQYVFPRLDNHQSVATDDPINDWPLRINWHDTAPKLIILGEHVPLSSADAVVQISSSLRSALTESCPQADVLLSHTLENLESLLAGHRGTRVKQTFSPHQPPTRFFPRLLWRLSDNAHASSIYVTHLTFSLNGEDS